MKTILLCIATSLFFIACSDDADLKNTLTPPILTDGAAINKDYPANLANPFDSNGKNIYDALQAYFEANRTVNSLEELTDQISFISERLNVKSSLTGRLIPFTNAMVDSIMVDPDNNMIAIVHNSSLQSYAKNNLIAFLQELIIKRQQEFSVIYSYITAYESDVLADEAFTPEETETILTVSSISRYSLYSAEERKDRDWEILVGGKQARPFFESKEASIICIIALLEKLL